MNLRNTTSDAFSEAARAVENVHFANTTDRPFGVIFTDPILKSTRRNTILLRAESKGFSKRVCHLVTALQTGCPMLGTGWVVSLWL